MKINGRWHLHDEVSGLSLTIIEGERLNRLHIDIHDQRLIANRDFYFDKDGDFDGTGSGLCPPDERES